MKSLGSLLVEGGVEKIVMRGDCCSLHTITQNRDLFPNLRRLLQAQKAPAVCLVEALRGVRAMPSRVLDLFRTEDFDPQQLYYFKEQFVIDPVLDSAKADLIVIDSYADMNFPLFRHRESGGLVWLDQRHLKYPEKLDRDFEFVGRRSFTQAVEDNIALIAHLRASSPDAPILYLTQPVEYYSPLNHRIEFNYLGAELAKRVDNFHFAGALSFDDLDPVDMDSCGPGQTLHFSSKTYRRMIANAVSNADDPELVTALARDPDRYVSFHRLHLVEPREAILHGHKVANIDMNVGAATVECVPSCDEQVSVFRKSLESYTLFEGDEIDRTLGYHPAIIDLRRYKNFQAFVDAVKPISKGNKVREAKKALREGFRCKPFPWKLHIPDIHAINHSEEVRSGGKMTTSYLRTIEDMGGYPTKHEIVSWPSCSYHWRMTWGVFADEPGHKQGEILVDERLVGYISLVRFGHVALYSQFLGHGDYLAKNVMVLLHFEIMRWILDSGQPFTKGLKYLMYGGWESGSGDSLRDWKRRVGFEPFLTVASLHNSPAAGTVDEHGL